MIENLYQNPPLFRDEQRCKGVCIINITYIRIENMIVVFLIFKCNDTKIKIKTKISFNEHLQTHSHILKKKKLFTCECVEMGGRHIILVKYTGQ